MRKGTDTKLKLILMALLMVGLLVFGGTAAAIDSEDPEIRDEPWSCFIFGSPCSDCGGCPSPYCPGITDDPGTGCYYERCECDDVDSPPPSRPSEDPPAFVPVTGIRINSCPESMSPGETITLNATVSPPNATNKHIVWMYQETLGALQSSHGSSLTTTADQGPFLEVTAISSCNNQIRDTCRISVIHPIEIRLEPASLRLAPQVIEDRGRKSERVSVVINPPDAPARVFWTSSHPDLVQVYPQGDGTEATITAFSPPPRDPSAYSEITVGVIAEVEIAGDNRWGLIREFYSCEVTLEFHPVEQVIIRPHVHTSAPRRSLALLELDGGEELVMEAMVLPRNATDKRVEWKTTNMDAGNLMIYPGEPFYTTFTAARGLRVYQDTYIIVKSVSNPDIADYFQLRSYGPLRPDRPDSVHDLSDQERQIIEQPRQVEPLPEDDRPIRRADFSQGIPDHFPPPVIWEPEPKEAIPQTMFQFVFMNTAYYTWKILDYVPGKKSLVNAYIELTINKCPSSALKEFLLGKLGPLGAAIDHIISATHPEGDRWASAGVFGVRDGVGEFQRITRELERKTRELERAHRKVYTVEEHMRRIEQEEEERDRRTRTYPDGTTFDGERLIYPEVPPPQ